MNKDKDFKRPSLKERFLAFLIDMVVVLALCLIPKVGWIFGLIYFLGRDAMPSLKGRSIGKKVLKIRILTTGTHETLDINPDKSVTRGLILLIPVVNIIDIYMLLTTGRRLADRWTETEVIKET